MDAGDLRVISLERYDKIQLGYAFTTHSLQGDTREASYVLVGGSMQDRELSYVQMSRHRGEAHIYAATEEVGNSLETMADVMSRPSAIRDSRFNSPPVIRSTRVAEELRRDGERNIYRAALCPRKFALATESVAVVWRDCCLYLSILLAPFLHRFV